MSPEQQNKVFCIGLPRTGTTSMHLAFLCLGYRSIHNPKEIWPDLDHPLLRENDAFSDTPIPLLYKQLDNKFPGSKFIVTTRRMEPWLKSCEWMFSKKAKDWGFFLEPTRTLHFMLFGTDRFVAEKFEQTYLRFHNEVKGHFSESENLLELNLEEENDPWGKLCHFLKKAQPSVKFPHHKDFNNEAVNRVANWLEQKKYKKSAQ